MTTNIFEYAAVTKLRFATDRGNITVEQLWDIPLTSNVTTANLNSIAVALDEEIAATGKNRRIASAKTPESITIKLAIVEHIMQAKQDAADHAKQAAIDATKKAKLLRKIGEMEDADLTDGKSLKQLKKEANKL